MSSTPKPRIAIVGAGLCGSLLAVLLRDRFDVTVIEQGTKPVPLMTDLDCPDGEVTSSINRAQGLGGTTNYWHNALIELADDDLLKAGIPPADIQPYYAKAWSLFLSDAEVRHCEQVRDDNLEVVAGRPCTVAHMVLPRTRNNLWDLAQGRYPGSPISVVHGKARRIVRPPGSTTTTVDIEAGRTSTHVEVDHVVVCAGGLATPALLAESLGEPSSFCPGYHDHPMAYVAKVRLRPDSRLKVVSCTNTKTTEVRAGFVHEAGGVKTVLYLRPAMNLNLRSIEGPARFILSDLRNSPFSPVKLWRVLTNLEAVREGILFKSKAGFLGDYYSVLLLGEQESLETRGLRLEPGSKPHLNWHIAPAEHRSYQDSLNAFFEAFAPDIVERRVLPADKWEYRTAAHHSGTARRFLQSPGELSLDFFGVNGLSDAYVCDGSILRAGGIANSGLTLAALTFRLADLLIVST